jgi:peptidoglycan/LPS O-acetylase OafA/YrhL
VLNSTHTILHLDCIALGSLLGLGLMSRDWTRRTWLWVGIVSTVGGFGAAATLAGGTPFADSALGLGFAGVVLTAIAGTGARNPLAWVLRRGPLPFYGQISYGLYLTHMSVFISLGVVYLRVDGSSIGGSCWGNLTVVAIQFAACTALATLLWHGFEKRILRLKKYFPSGR